MLTTPTDKIDQTEEELTSCIHDLFLNKEYVEWRRALRAFSTGEWHLLTASLAKKHVPTEAFLEFGQEIYPNLVFSYIEAPDHAESQMLMVQFTVPGSMWQCLVWHCPERN
ncbi:MULTISPECIES: hypothetical protein [Pseudomonas syringae group]|uniref:Uncharacterized protein n=2 Tax=Pseudomonas syringae group TaxID=136849 RepID=A0A2K4WXF1_PSESX|nr:MULTISPECIES: hypothetical protein [Pseudomonas syringae group]KWS55839.1 hypothetical protein AL056_04770 [Pseudomonas amygdali pv. morsprunorum]KWS61542.1 hypothetical protein AL054_05500 [Pseudomonas amygdali pv. morsprunorum]MDT3226203.1 hypothetical protein [Pseudomonas amygdali pv. morsprunorum]MDT3239215.1 hypothetical protein [Pseudomonas amygdali pv. morsprunorum]MDT3264615.1 hypothetical protein [Pseudomonas amygdali pv. morsprunorum]